MKYEKSLTMVPDTWSPSGPPVALPTTDTTIAEDGLYRFYPAVGLYVTFSNAAISFTPSYTNGAYMHYNGLGWGEVYLKAGDHIKSSSNLGSYQHFIKS